MIRQLLSLFKSDYSLAASHEEKFKILETRVNNFRYSYMVFLCLTLCWLFWEIFEYQVLSTRPAILYFPENYLSKSLMATFPNPFLFYSLLITAIAIALLLFRYTNSVILKLVLFLICTWLNMAQWGWGFFSHVNHLFLLAHLLFIFIPLNFNSASEKENLYKGIVWLHFGILSTYVMAGIWKLGGLSYKIVFEPESVNWVHPKASWLNAVVSYRANDYPIANQIIVFDWPIIWQAGFVFIVLIQCFAFIAAFKQKVQVWLMAMIFIFHFINSFAFCTIFIWQPLVICILFFPYDKVFDFNSKEYHL